ncbi:MAG: hypothetical protein K8S55_08605 [Phycisphaerae bacterium]|nr:hypothetical protein [Phycisphaerae bacterium]
MKKKEIILLLTCLFLITIYLALQLIDMPFCFLGSVLTGYGCIASIILYINAIMLRANIRYKISTIVMLWFSLICIWWYPWTVRKEFIRDLNRICSGMKVSDIRHILKEYQISDIEIESEKQYTGHIQIWRSANNPKFKLKYNADVGDIYFKNGFVERVEFLPD